MTSDVITTHFDYHSIDSNPGILGRGILHIRMLRFGGLDATTIPRMTRVMSLFKNTDALGLHGSFEEYDNGTLVFRNLVLTLMNC